MTLQEYYDALESHDWYWHMADRNEYHRAGEYAESRLIGIAKQSPEHQALFNAWEAYMFPGHGSPKLPKPKRP